MSAKLVEKLQQQQAGAAEGAAGDDAAGAEQKQDEVVDAEFEEVKDEDKGEETKS